MAILKNIRKSRGFTLVELMIVVVIIGILAALAIYGVRKYVSNSKSAEARLALGAISKGAVTAFEGESMAGTLLALGGTIGSSRRLCDSSTQVPSDDAAISGGLKYQSDDEDWQSGSQNAGWQCLKFSLTGPQYFTYQYIATNPTGTDGSYQAVARTNADADAVWSTFQLLGEVENGVLKVSPSIIETNPDE